MESKDAVKLLMDAGWTFVRTKGSHHTYRSPAGAKFDVPCGGKHADLSDGVLAKLRRALKDNP